MDMVNQDIKAVMGTRMHVYEREEKNHSGLQQNDSLITHFVCMLN